MRASAQNGLRAVDKCPVKVHWGVMAWIESMRQAAQHRVAEQEARVAKQALLIVGLKKNGLSAHDAERLLAIMQESLDAFQTSLRLFR